MDTTQIRLCFVGNMLGRNPGYVTSQGQIVADLFAGNGYRVISVSSEISRVRRLTDMVQTIVRNAKKIDVAILEVYSGLSMVVADTISLVCKSLGIPLIAVLHGGNLPAFSKHYRRWTTRVLRRADILVAPSSFLAKELESFGFQVRVIPNVVELETYPYKMRRHIAPKMIWMRSFHPIYNPQMALKVFSSIHEKNPEATLVMAGGDKGLESELKAMTNKMDLQNAVRFPGFLDSRAKIKEFSEADIYLNTNRIDNMPVAVVEACAMGLPVVSTNVGGLPHIISHGENGFLVPDEDVSEMVNAVNRLLDSPELSEKFSKNGRRFAEQSAWSAVRPEWEKAFVEAVKKKT